MAATARTMRLASRLSAISRPSIPRAVSSVAQRATFTASARLRKSEVIKETEVPVSVYSPDAKGVASSSSDHFNIPVQSSFKAPEPAPEPEDQVTPLDAKVFKQMPRTLQKMSVMGKVIIITGYVSFLANRMMSTRDFRLIISQRCSWTWKPHGSCLRRSRC